MRNFLCGHKKPSATICNQISQVSFVCGRIVDKTENEKSFQGSLQNEKQHRRSAEEFPCEVAQWRARIFPTFPDPCSHVTGRFVTWLRSTLVTKNKFNLLTLISKYNVILFWEKTTQVSIKSFQEHEVNKLQWKCILQTERRNAIKITKSFKFV